MKSQTLPVKRRPVPKGILRRLSAVTRNRKQRVAAAAVPSGVIEEEDSSSKISRALTIIFLIHIVAIGLIFVHQRFLDGRPSESKDAPKAAGAQAASVAQPAAEPREDLPRLSSGERPYIVRAGDNYARIAAAEGVDEGDLRMLNKQVDIGPGLILKIPPKRIAAVEPPAVTASREQAPAVADSGLVEAVDVSDAPKAKLVHPHEAAAPRAKAASAPPAKKAAGGSYVVQSGDSIWRIANRFKISQDALMHANGISDAHKMKTGMTLVIPSH